MQSPSSGRALFELAKVTVVKNSELKCGCSRATELTTPMCFN
jgi:hypothetical protein